MKKKVIILLLSFIFFSTVPAFGEKTINIAAIYALTGPAAEANALTIQGINYAVAEINSQGGLLGRKIKMLLLDNKSTPIGSTLAARQAAESDIVAIVGSDWSSHSIAAARVAQESGVPMISSYSTNPEVTKIGNYIFRVCFTDDFQGQTIARFACQDLKAKTAVIFIDVTSDYSLTLTDIFRKNFEKLGGRVILELEYKLKQKSFDEEINKAVKAGADIFFIPGHDESGQIVKHAQAVGASSIFIGGDGWSTPVFFNRGGAELKHGYYSTHWSPFLDTDQSRSFVKRYLHSEFNFVNTALGYDSLMLLADAIRRAGSTERKKIRDAIAATVSFDGVTGTISFNKSGDPVKSIVFMEIINGKPRYLKTMHPLTK